MSEQQASNITYEIIMWMKAHDFKYDIETGKWIYDEQYLSEADIWRLFREDQGKLN